MHYDYNIILMLTMKENLAEFKCYSRYNKLCSAKVVLDQIFREFMCSFNQIHVCCPFLFCIVFFVVVKIVFFDCLCVFNFLDKS